MLNKKDAGAGIDAQKVGNLLLKMRGGGRVDKSLDVSAASRWIAPTVGSPVGEHCFTNGRFARLRLFQLM